MRRSRYCCLGVDPGPKRSGYVVVDYTPETQPIASVLWSGTIENRKLLEAIGGYIGEGVCALAIESFQSYGNTVGKTVFEACRWSGRFEQRFREAGGCEVFLVPNPGAKLVLCGRRNASESELRSSVVSLLGPVGSRRDPGPLYGVTGHAWSALAVVASVFYLMAYADTDGLLKLWRQM